MYIHESAKLVFLANPRTGSTAVAEALKSIGFVQVGTHHSTMEPNDTYTTFAVVRNHWDAAVSWVFGKHLEEYKNLAFTVKDFEFALDNEYVTEHEMWAYHKPSATIRYESLETSVNLVLAFFGLQPVKLPLENVSTVRLGHHYHAFYNDETREYIRNRFSEEIERLGYEY